MPDTPTASPSRVPTSAPKDGWSIETAIDYLLALESANMATLTTALHQKIAHLVSISDERDRRYTERFEAMQQAVSKAEGATERRFDSVNEFRSQLGDQARTFMPRAEAEIRYTGLAERIDKNAMELTALRSLMDATGAERRGSSVGARQGWMWAAGAIGLVLTVLSIVSVLVVLYGKVKP